MSLRDVAFSAAPDDNRIYVEDVFSTYLYNGNDNKQAIKNNIALASSNEIYMEDYSVNQGDSIEKILFDSSNNRYVIGNTNNGLNGTVIKFSPNNTQLWATRLNSATNFVAGTLDSSGNLYVIGSDSPTNQALIVKLDSSGSILWQKKLSYGGISLEVFYSIGIDSSGNIYLAGFIWTGSNERPGFLTKLDSTGIVLFTKFYYSTAYSGGESNVIVDGNDNVYMAVKYYNGVYGGGTAILKVSSTDGTVLWTKTYSGVFTRAAKNALILDSSNNLIVAMGTSNNIVLAKFNSSGVLQSETEITTPGGYYPSITKDSSDNYYIISGNETDIVYVTKVNSSFSVSWTNSITTNSSSSVYAKNIVYNNNYLFFSVKTSSTTGSVLVKTDLSGSNNAILDSKNFVGIHAITNFSSGNVTFSKNQVTDITVLSTSKSTSNTSYTTSSAGSYNTAKKYDAVTGEGGLVWIKCRGPYAGDHRLVDTFRGATKSLSTAGSLSELTVTTGLTSFNTSGFSIGADFNYNNASNNYVSWTFRKAPKFFDVVKWTGDGATDKAVFHSLGARPGAIIIKATSATNTNWIVQFDVLQSSRTYLVLNSTAAGVATSSFPTAISWNNDSVFYTHGGWPTGTGNDLNTNGVSYVAYIFAHDIDPDGFIQCGTFTTDSACNFSVDLGWEPQYVLFKASSTTSDWNIIDSARQFTVDGYDELLSANSGSTRIANTNYPKLTSTGFTGPAVSIANSGTFVYIAIRRGPMKTPTTGTEVYSATTYTGNSIGGVDRVVFYPGFDGDTFWFRNRSVATPNYGAGIVDRLRCIPTYDLVATGTIPYDLSPAISTFSTTSETNLDGVTGIFGKRIAVQNNSGYLNFSGVNYVVHAFRRARGFFDVVCYTGTGVARTVNHNLGVVPELMIMKSRNNGYFWPVYAASLGANDSLGLNTANQKSGANSYWNTTAPTASVFSVGTSVQVNESGTTFVAYLFASCPGISKVGSYTGNGSNQTINCGFTTGARFVLIKRTDSTGDWYVWDTARGIVSANDPHLSLNTTAAEVTTDDSVDPTNSGFIVNQVAATNINVTSATYIYLAIA